MVLRGWLARVGKGTKQFNMAAEPGAGVARRVAVAVHIKAVAAA